MVVLERCTTFPKIMVLMQTMPRKIYILDANVELFCCGYSLDMIFTVLMWLNS